MIGRAAAVSNSAGEGAAEWEGGDPAFALSSPEGLEFDAGVGGDLLEIGGLRVELLGGRGGESEQAGVEALHVAAGEFDLSGFDLGDGLLVSASDDEPFAASGLDVRFALGAFSVDVGVGAGRGDGFEHAGEGAGAVGVEHERVEPGGGDFSAGPVGEPPRPVPGAVDGDRAEVVVDVHRPERRRRRPRGGGQGVGERGEVLDRRRVRADSHRRHQIRRRQHPIAAEPGDQPGLNGVDAQPVVECGVASGLRISVEVDGDLDEDVVVDDGGGGVSEEVEVAGSGGVFGFVGPCVLESGDGVSDRDRGGPVVERDPGDR